MISKPANNFTENKQYNELWKWEKLKNIFSTTLFMFTPGLTRYFKLHLLDLMGEWHRNIACLNSANIFYY